MQKWLFEVHGGALQSHLFSSPNPALAQKEKTPPRARRRTPPLGLAHALLQGAPAGGAGVDAPSGAGTARAAAAAAEGGRLADVVQYITLSVIRVASSRTSGTMP